MHVVFFSILLIEWNELRLQMRLIVIRENIYISLDIHLTHKILKKNNHDTSTITVSNGNMSACNRKYDLIFTSKSIDILSPCVYSGIYL